MSFVLLDGAVYVRAYKSGCFYHLLFLKYSGQIIKIYQKYMSRKCWQISKSNPDGRVKKWMAITSCKYPAV